MSIRIGIGLGTWPFAEDDPKLLWRYVERAEALGIDSLWFSDRLIPAGPLSGPLLEPLTVMAAIAARTSRLKFGPAVLALALRNPVWTAKQIATIDFLSEGRMLPAFGLGSEDEREYEAAGIAKEERAHRVAEAVTVMRRLWTEDHVTHHGRFFHLTDVTIDPKPAQKAVPIWFGGRSEAALRRVGRLGDGWLASFITPAETATGIQRIKEYAAEAGRQIDDDHYGVLISCYVAADAAKARQVAEGTLMRRRPELPLDDYCALGTPDDCIHLIRRYIAAGASKFVLRPVCPPQAMFEQLDLISREVVAPLQEALTG